MALFRARCSTRRSRGRHWPCLCLCTALQVAATAHRARHSVCEPQQTHPAPWHRELQAASALVVVGCMAAASLLSAAPAHALDVEASQAVFNAKCIGAHWTCVGVVLTHGAGGGAISASEELRSCTPTDARAHGLRPGVCGACRLPPGRGQHPGSWGLALPRGAPAQRPSSLSIAAAWMVGDGRPQAHHEWRGPCHPCRTSRAMATPRQRRSTRSSTRARARCRALARTAPRGCDVGGREIDVASLLDVGRAPHHATPCISLLASSSLPLVSGS